MATRFHRQPTKTRGYTVVELLVSLTVMAIGVSGIIAMESATASSNRHAKNLSIASHIAQSWIDQLESEAGQWNATNDFDQTLWLGKVKDDNGNWFRPVYDTARNFGPAFDASGSPVKPLDVATRAEFCSDIQLTWLFDQAGGSGVIRAQVRVYWRRSGVEALTVTPLAHVCSVTDAQVATGEYLRMFHFVHVSSAIRQYRSAL